MKTRSVSVPEGVTACALLRRLGREGFSDAEAAAVAEFAGFHPAPATVARQVADGKAGRGAPPAKISKPALAAVVVGALDGHVAKWRKVLEHSGAE